MRKYLFLLLSLGTIAIQAQTPVEMGLLPEFTLGYQFNDQWKLNAQLESMQRGWRRTQEGLAGDYDYVRTDLTLVANYRIRPLVSAGAGYLLRFSDGALTHRTLQQIALVQRLPNGRIGHRWRTDQTYQTAATTRYRLRYRFSWETALRGQRVDDHEFYLITSWELVGSKQAGDYGLENRLTGGLGYNINNEQQLEFGLDHRWDRLFEDTSRHRIWWTIGYFIDLN